MNRPDIDYAAVYQALPGAVALVTPQLVYLDVNKAYLRITGRKQEELLGRYIFDVFPDNPDDPTASGMRNLAASLRRVAATGERDSMALQRYDVEDPDRPGVFVERYWSLINAPVFGSDGEVLLIVLRVEEITELLQARAGAEDEDRIHVLEAELYTRARELQEVNERLRRAHARDREVALSLQEAMLPAPRPLGRHRAAVRYRPATGALHVCGDWYDMVSLGNDRIAVTVGDVVGHGLAAAGVMGQLRSALGAAARVADGPSQALEVLGRYARSVEGAESTTAVEAVIDWTTRTITYSSAGHPPPILLNANGAVQFLDQATDPPLGACPEHLPGRLEADTAFAEGATLVLYTDGLIERRHEDIDAGLARLAGAVARHRGADPETMADALLAELLPVGGNSDDTALVILSL